MKYALTLAFKGSKYSGWQVQKNAPSVQAAVQDAVEKVFGSRLGVTGCSRTDSGVHAIGYVCHIESEKRIDAQKLPLALNSQLPRDISVLSAREVGADFHARYSALGKEYLYVLKNSPLRDPFSEGLCCPRPFPLDAAKLQRLAQSYVGTHDFRAFMSAGSKIKDTVRTVYCFEVTQRGAFVVLRAVADGFLYNMVRIMAGTLLKAAKGARDIEEALASKERSKAGPTAPACGLCLSRVFYSPEDLRKACGTDIETDGETACGTNSGTVCETTRGTDGETDIKTDGETARETDGGTDIKTDLKTTETHTSKSKKTAEQAVKISKTTPI